MRTDEKILQELIEVMHFTENVSARIHGLLDEGQIYRRVKEEFVNSKRYTVSILLLSPDGEKLRIAETSLAPEKQDAGEKVTGLRLKEYELILDRSSAYSQVVKEGKTVEVNVSQTIGELFPQPLACLITSTLSYQDKKSILTPLYRQGKIIGVLSMTSVELSRYLIPSVKNLAKHISRALELAEERHMKKVLLKENTFVKEELQLSDRYCEMIGKSHKMKTIFSLIDRVAKTSSPVLVTGESGTGKELVAKAIHRNSNRRGTPFIVVDCASLSENLLENELFGHEKGAFTDASSMKRGLFEITDTGTLFIDEIGEMKLATQSKLLRAIETHQFRRLGGTKQIQIDVRIIVATNRDLVKEVRNGNFREDLYYRLNVVTIHLPPLRERKEDIPLLVNHFIANSQVTATKKKVSKEFMEFLMEYDWPGNVRELANVIERAIIISTSDYITPADLPVDFCRRPGYSVSPSDRISLTGLLKDFEKDVINRVLEQCRGNKVKAARSLKLSRSKLYRKLREYNIR